MTYKIERGIVHNFTRSHETGRGWKPFPPQVESLDTKSQQNVNNVQISGMWCDFLSTRVWNLWLKFEIFF